RFFLDGWRGVNKSSLTINEYQICPNQIPVFIKEAAQGCRRYMGATKCSSGVRKARSRFILQRFHLHGQVREIWVIYPHFLAGIGNCVHAISSQSPWIYLVICNQAHVVPDPGELKDQQT